jgi:hypothetical protein
MLSVSVWLAIVPQCGGGRFAKMNARKWSVFGIPPENTINHEGHEGSRRKFQNFSLREPSCPSWLMLLLEAGEFYAIASVALGCVEG